MKTFQLEGKSREVAATSADQKRALKAMRKNNEIPAVLYGGEKVSHFTITKDSVRNLVYSPEIFVVELTIDGKKTMAIVKDIQFQPVTNPDGIYPMWATANGESTIAANESNSGYIEDGSFLRMQTLTLGYTLPKSILDKIKFEKIRIYGQIANVFTLTGYSGRRMSSCLDCWHIIEELMSFE